MAVTRMLLEIGGLLIHPDLFAQTDFVDHTYHQVLSIQGRGVGPSSTS